MILGEYWSLLDADRTRLRGRIGELQLKSKTMSLKVTYDPMVAKSIMARNETRPLVGIWLWVKTNGTILGEVHHPFLEPILVGIGMFTGGTIWLLTRAHLRWGIMFLGIDIGWALE